MPNASTAISSTKLTANLWLEFTLSTQCEKAALMETNRCELPNRIGVSSTPSNTLAKMLSDSTNNDSTVPVEEI